MKKFKLKAIVLIILISQNKSIAQSLSCVNYLSATSTSNETMNYHSNCLARDSKGNLITIGNTTSNGSSKSDYFISKSNWGCSTKWTKTYDGTGQDNDRTQDVIVGSRDNIYLTGSSVGHGTMEDMLTLALDPSGNQLWTDRYDASNYWDYGTAITVSKLTGEVIVTGWSYHPSSSRSIVIRKLDPLTGALVWSQDYSIPNVNVESYGITTDVNGDIYICGAAYHLNSHPKYSEALLIKYDDAGNFIWDNKYTGPIFPNLNLVENAYYKVKINGNNIYACGMTAVGNLPVFAGVNEDLLLNQFDPNGNLNWTATYDRAQFGDVAYDMVVDPNGNIDLVGLSYKYNADNDFGVYQIDGSGNMTWAPYFYNGSYNGSWDEGRSITLNECDNHIYACGVTQLAASGANYNFLTLELDPLGALVWAQTFTQAASLPAEANSISTFGSGGLSVAGYSSDASGNSSITDLSYKLPDIIPCARTASATLVTQDGISVFPNPSQVNSSFFVETKNIHATAKISLSVYAVDGSLVMQKDLQGKQKEEIKHNLKPGVYFVKLQSASDVQTLMITIL